MKTFLILIVSIVGLFIVATAAMFVVKMCPPQGPWPTPPWCGKSVGTLKTIKQFIPSKVDIYGRVYFKDPQDWSMNEKLQRIKIRYDTIINLIANSIGWQSVKLLLLTIVI